MPSILRDKTASLLPGKGAPLKKNVSFETFEKKLYKIGFGRI